MKKTYTIKHINIYFADHRVSSNGVDLNIDMKAVEVLQLLVNTPGETVSTDQFMDKIWHDKPSAPEVIPAAIARLRKMFKQAGISEELIVTVHKVGYRFVPPQTTESESRDSGWRKQSWFATLLLLLLAALATSLYFNINMPKAVVFEDSNNNSVQLNQQNDSEATQIYILRHTEKADDVSEDPELSPLGIKHAKYWKKVLQHIEFNQVLTTDFRRNIQTAKLLSAESSVNPELYYPMSFDVLKFIRQIQGQTVLIIGHSNTIPDMVNRLIGESKYPPMSHNNYDLLFTITINKNGDTSSSMLHIEMPQ